MGFLAPWFLAGVAAVGLPVWLHLLRKHKTTPLPFSSLMFFERRTQSSIKHRRLRYLVLFTLRTLLILLIVLAFARPFVQQRIPPRTRSNEITVLAIDNSLSMRAGKRLADAKAAAKSLVSSLKPCLLYTSAGAVRDRDPGAARDRRPGRSSRAGDDRAVCRRPLSHHPVSYTHLCA